LIQLIEEEGDDEYQEADLEPSNRARLFSGSLNERTPIEPSPDVYVVR
jgi:hypothetical protein